MKLPMPRRNPIIVIVVILSSMFLLHILDEKFSIRARKPCDKSDDNCLVYRPEVKLAFITSYYHGNDVERQSEIDICLASLFGSPLLEKVHVMVEEVDVPFLPSFATGSPKMVKKIISNRPLMGDFIQYACDNLQDFRVIYANADIFYDITLEYFTKLSDKKFDNTFFAISRWWLSDKGMTPDPYPEWGSYDTFVFSPKTICSDKAKLYEIISNLNYTLGISGAENRLLYEVNRQYPEIKLINPAYTIKSVHIHRSPDRASNYNQYVHWDGKSINIPPESFL